MNRCTLGVYKPDLYEEIHTLAYALILVSTVKDSHSSYL